MSYRPKVLEVANGGTGLASTTANQILYSSAANTIAGLATANNGILITSAGGVPSISSTLPSAVQSNITSTGNLGNQLNTTRTCFNVNLTGNVTNATGDGTNYQIAFNNKLFDQNSDFNTSTHVMTYPLTARYLHTFSVMISNLTASYTIGYVNMITSGVQYFFSLAGVGAARDTGSGIAQYGFTGSFIINAAANDTASLNVLVSGSTKSITVTGGSGYTNWGCYLLC